jgi:hypothetical protein
MSAESNFNRAQICAGTEIVLAGAVPKATYPIVFEKKMEGTPNVTLIAIKSNQNVIAVNVSTTGFDLIISDNGMSEPNTSFEVHYQAIFTR